MAAAEPDGKVEIKVLRAKRLATLGNPRFRDKFRVKLSMGNREFITETKSRNMHELGSDVSWNVPFMFTFVGQMPNLTLEVSGVDSDDKDIFVGRTVVSYLDSTSGSPPEIGVERTYTFPLSGENGKAMPDDPELIFSVKIVSLGADEPVDNLALILQQASDTLDRLKGPTIPVLPERTRASGAAVASASSILESIGKIADIMDELNRIHPYAKAAWDILDLTQKVIKTQMKEDDSIRDLSEQMGSLLHRMETFVEWLDNISPSDANIDEKRILRDIARVSRDCATFIISFCNDNFAKRAIKCALFGDTSERIAEFKSKFALLDKSLNEKVWDVMALGVRQIPETAAQVAEFMVRSASLLASSHRSCYPGTQVTIRKKIADWIDRVDEDVPRVLLLSGMAGTGKSTIAYTIAEEHELQGKLYTSFAFNRRAQPPPSARMLFPHVAAFLAASYPAVRKALIEKKEIAFGVDFERQLRELILEPLKQPRPNAPGRIVILVDGIDESDSDGVQAGKLASLLVTACDELPRSIRIFVTSRVETYVVTTMWPSAIHRLDMPEPSAESLAEVRLFIRDQLQGLPDIGELQYDNLMTTSQGLFQWAATACKEIIGAPLQGGSTRLERYNEVVASGLGRDEIGLLDSLYEDVLNRAFAPKRHQLLKWVIAALFAMMELMTLDAFRELYARLGFGDASDVDCTLPYLPSVLDGVTNSNRTRPVQPNHTSLRDFFLDPGRSGFFCVKDLMPGTHDCVARGSFSIMSTALPQVACTPDFTRVWNKSGGFNSRYIVSEGERVQGEMPQDVQYAILYGVKHLAEAPAPEAAFWMRLTTLLLINNYALHWIELFCLLAVHKLRHTNKTSPELSGCMQLLAHIAKRPGSSCPPRIQSAAKLASTILGADSDPPFNFDLGWTLCRLGQIYESVAWTVMLQRQPEYGPLVTIGTGLFLRLDGASHDVVLTMAHNLLDTNECPRADLVINIPKQVPRLDGATQFSDIQIRVPPMDIHVCVDFSKRQELETDWAAIRLPRGTALGDGFLFDIGLEGPDTVAQGTYRQLSWMDHQRHHPLNDWDTRSVDDMLVNPVARGAPIYAFGAYYPTPIVQGICNPTYGHEAFTKLTPALIRELWSWVNPGHILWAGTTLIDPEKDNETPKVDRNLKIWRLKPTEENRSFYLYVNPEDSKLYFREGSGSLFEIYSKSGLDHHRTLHHNFEVVVVEDGCLVCRPTSTSPDREHTNYLWIKMDKDQQYSRMWVHACIGSECFYFQLGPMIAGSRDDNRLFSISLQRLKMYEVAGKNEELTYGYTCTEFEFVQQS